MSDRCAASTPGELDESNAVIPAEVFGKPARSWLAVQMQLTAAVLRECAPDDYDSEEEAAGKAEFREKLKVYLDDAFADLAAIDPARDSTEALLRVQGVGMHNLAMLATERAMRAGDNPIHARRS